MSQQDRVEVPFQAHVELLQSFLADRDTVVKNIEQVLNAQRQPVQYLQDRALLARRLEDCFFALPAVDGDQLGLRGRLEEAHWASGFKPRQVPGLFNDLIHPAELMIRGFYLWQQTRWPGRNGRISFAQTLFNLFVLRCLQFLSLRLWDSPAGQPGERLSQLQALLDALWQSSPAEQPVFVRDARWLIPMAQSPTTDGLAPYFIVAERVANSLPDQDGLEIARAHARMLGGHLTSQIRHYCMKEGVSIDDASVIRRTRTSNALDFALLIQCLVPLLSAYESAVISGDYSARSELAGAICQSISPDPELFLGRVDLLGPYSLIEDVFIEVDSDGRAVYTALGRRQLESIQQYEVLIGRLTKALFEDSSRLRPIEGAYSPFGAIFGTPTNLVEDMALKSLQRETEPRFSLEDVFDDAGDRAGKLAWVSGWRKLPHIDPEVQKLYEFPQHYAEQIFERVERELAERASGAASHDANLTGRLYIAGADELPSAALASEVRELPIRYIASSDEQRVAADQAEPLEQARLLRDRAEGYFLVSFETGQRWTAVRKELLTEVLGEGEDAKIAGLPSEAAGVLGLMCLGLAVPGDAAA
ncbi:MAG: hypothetical protein PVF50_05200 [Gammaproteobacteria bacterium]